MFTKTKAVPSLQLQPNFLFFLSNRATWDNRETAEKMRSVFYGDVFVDVVAVGS